MDLNGLIITLGMGFLGFAIGLAVGHTSTVKQCYKAFRNEGYSYSEFYEVLDNEK